MGSLPNLNDLSALNYPHYKLCKELKSPESSVTTSTCGKRSLSISPRHQPVKHVRSVDLNFYHTVRRPGDHRQATCRAETGGGYSLGVCLDRKHPQISVRRLNSSSQKVTNEACINAASPVSSRSARSRSSSTVGHLTQHSVHTTTARHRDSMSSSAGASSVRQLIAQVRSTPSKLGPVYSRKVIHKNWAALCLANAFLTSALVPLLGLQSSISSWWWPPENKADMNPKWFFLTADIGSLLLASLFAIGSLSSLSILAVIKRFGTNSTINISYGCALIFFAAHLYPNLYTLIPSYLIMGLSLGPLAGARVAALMSLATKYSYVLSDSEEHEVNHSDHTSRRDTIVQKLARYMQTSQDLGLVVGSLVTGFVLKYTLGITQDFNDSKEAINSMYRTNELGARICGAGACPVSLDPKYLADSFYGSINITEKYSLVLPCKSCMFLASIFIGFCIVAWVVAIVFTDRIVSNHDIFDKNNFTRCYIIMADTFKDPQLQLVGPMALFIGLTQGFMYADYTKSYVVCSLDLFNVTWVFVALGALQCVCGATISLMLQQIKRIYIISLGFMFHSCLMLVLIHWVPTSDDPLLLYVTGSTWGVCNSIWECLTFSLLIAIYQDTWLPAIGHHYFFRYLGISMMFTFHGVFCNITKLYFLSAMLVISVLAYATLELKLYNSPTANSRQL